MSINYFYPQSFNVSTCACKRIRKGCRRLTHKQQLYCCCYGNCKTQNDVKNDLKRRATFLDIIGG